MLAQGRDVDKKLDGANKRAFKDEILLAWYLALAA